MVKFKSKILSLIVIFSLPFITFFITYYAYIGHTKVALILVGHLVLMILAHILNKKNFYNASRYVLLFTVCSVLGYSVINFGLEPQVQFFLGLVVMLNFMLSDRASERIISNSLVLITWLGSFYYVDTYGNIIEASRMPYDFYFNFGFGLISYGVFAYLIFKEFMNYISDINFVNNSLVENNEKLIQQNNVIEQQKNELELFTNMASHDLKTPIRTINSFLNLIERKIDVEDQQELQNYVSLAQSGSKQLSDLIFGISEYIKLEDHQQDGSITNMNSLIKDVISNLSNKTDVQFNIADLSQIKINKIHLRSLFQNFIENSIKYNESEVKTITITGSHTSEYYDILIKDNGIGIDPKYLKLIFEPFKRLHPNHVYKGTGLGLSICKKIMTKHGGQIKIDSKESVGTSFVLSFPAKLVFPNEKPIPLEK